MPLQKLRGVAIFASLQECGFSRLSPSTGLLTLHSHATKLGLRSTSSNAIIPFLCKRHQSEYHWHKIQDNCLYCVFSLKIRKSDLVRLFKQEGIGRRQVCPPTLSFLCCLFWAYDQGNRHLLEHKRKDWLQAIYTFPVWISRWTSIKKYNKKSLGTCDLR